MPQPIVTLDQVREQFADEEWAGFDVTTTSRGSKSTETFAFRAPNLAEIKLYIQNAEGAKDNNEHANTVLLQATLLTHSAEQLDKVIQKRPGFLNKAAKGVVDLMSAGIEPTKKS
jgi:hypothetical protein